MVLRICFCVQTLLFKDFQHQPQNQGIDGVFVG